MKPQSAQRNPQIPLREKTGRVKSFSVLFGVIVQYRKVSLCSLWLIALLPALCLSPSALYAVHEVAGGIKCLDCHVGVPLDASRACSFNAGTSDTCRVCHKGHIHDHPCNVVPSMQIPRDMPLDIKGRLTCITCHSFHTGYVDAEGGRAFFLRRERGKTFCYGCHKKL